MTDDAQMVPYCVIAVNRVNSTKLDSERRTGAVNGFLMVCSPSGSGAQEGKLDRAGLLPQQGCHERLSHFPSGRTE